MSAGISVNPTGGTPHIVQNARPPAAISNAPAAGSTGVERRCENTECNVNKLVSMVPKRKTSQFVSDPNVMEKPMLINGFTTIFQVDGNSSKLCDLKNPSGGPVVAPKTLYRIVPNTHAHIVNYVVVDADGDSLRKINENDPATMRKLLDSQKTSADQMLKKLMAGTPLATAPVSAATSAAAAAAATASLGASIAPPTNMPSVGVLTPAVPVANIPPAANTATSKYISMAQRNKVNTPPLPTATTMGTQQQSSAIKLPVRMHPNLKITAVASADNVGALSVTPVSSPLSVSLVNTPQNLPQITTVPLANLQHVPPAMSTPTTSVPSSLVIQNVTSPAVVDTIEKPVFDKMQAELQELRRTVALLAEAQAKSNTQQMPTQIAPSGRTNKRPRQI